MPAMPSAISSPRVSRHHHGHIENLLPAANTPISTKGVLEIRQGDRFDDGRYTVVKELGQGTFAAVWLAVQEEEPKLVALKINHAKPLKIASREVEMLEQLHNAPHIVRMLSTFTHQGPQSVHCCIAFELMATHIDGLMERLTVGEYLAPDFSTLTRNNERLTGRRYLPWMAKRIIIDVLHALHSLHTLNIVHGDLHTRNILIGGKLNDNCMFNDFTPFHGPNSLRVKLADLGCAFYANKPPLKSPSIKSLTPPEMLLGGTPDKSLDIWAYGVLIYYIFTSRILVWPPSSSRTIDHILFNWYEILGPFPKPLIDVWAIRAEDRVKWFGSHNQLLTSRVAKITPSTRLEAQFKVNAPKSMSDEEAAAICGLIRSCLALDPAARPTTTDLLQHPYILEIKK